MSGSSSGRQLSRRGLLRAGTAIAGGATLTGCSLPVIERSGGDLVFWNLFGGGDGARLLDMLDRYEQEHRDINLRASTLSWGAPYYTKLAMAAVGGRPPDVAISHVSRLPAYAPADLLEPFDPELLAEFEIDQSRFDPTVWESATFGGQTYAIPLDTHPLIMFYNTEVCSQAGLLNADGSLVDLQGFDQYLDAFRAAQQVTGEYGLAYATIDIANPWRLFLSFYAQVGGNDILQDEGQTITIQRDQSIQALDYMAEITHRSGVAYSTINYDGAVAAFSNAQVGFYWNGEWEIATFIDQGMEFNAVPFPGIFGDGAFADSHTFVLPKNPDRTDAQRRRAYEFIRSMLSYSVTWAQGGHIPAYLPVAESQEYLSLNPQSNYRAAVETARFDPRAWYAGAASDMQSQSAAAFQQVLQGTISPEQGFDQFLDALERLAGIPTPV